MRDRFSSGSYLNFILTVVAVLLLAITLQMYGLPLVSSARAQDRLPRNMGMDTVPATAGESVARRAAPVDVSNIATVQDLAVAGATWEVASSNREIALAIRDLAEAVRGLAALAPTGGAAPAAAPAGAVVPVPGSGAMVEVGPATR